MPLGALATAIATQWLFKSIYEVVATPLTYLMVNFIKRKEGVDIYDYDTRFNPFMVSR